MQALGESWSTILAGDYREYSGSGNRDRFEWLYFSRLLKLNALVLGECAEGQGRFLDATIDGLWLICEESGWQLPAHNSHIRGGPRDPLPDPENPVIDLFAAETGANLALCLHLLGPELERANTNLVSRIHAEIDRRITTPYLNRHFWWMGNGAERMNNWTAWITQNVLLSTLLLPTDQPTRRSVVEKALESLDAFQKDYAEDGACEEGVLYYGHAALCMFGAMTIVESCAPGSIAPLFNAPKLRNMAEFVLNMHVAEDRFFNFADAPAEGRDIRGAGISLGQSRFLDPASGLRCRLLEPLTGPAYVEGMEPLVSRSGGSHHTGIVSAYARGTHKDRHSLFRHRTGDCP